jgi:Heliorhodopsin
VTEATHAPSTFRRLRIFNLLVGVVQLVQGVAILAISNDFTLPVTATYPTGPPGQDPPVLENVFDFPLGPAVAVFLLLAAADHLLVATPGVVGWYEKNLRRQRNYARWIEYSISASLMAVLIALIVGIADIGAMLAIFAANAAMILFGLLMEKHQSTENTDWTAFWFGSIVGAVPWIAIGIYLFGSDGAPGFVYGIFASLLLLFFSFAVNMFLQYRRIGPWRDYLFGERAYIVLSLVAKSALAWQVFANTLV